MPYVDRDEVGHVTGIYECAQREGHEFVEVAEMWVPPPSPLSQIRAIERSPEVSDAMQRGSRLVALSYALDDLIRVALARGQSVTRQQAHEWAMLNDSNYRKLYEAEQIIKPLRALV